MSEKHLYHLHDGEDWYIVATSEDEAIGIGLSDYELNADTLDEPIRCEQVPDNKAFRVRMMDERLEDVAKGLANGEYPPGATVDGQCVTATAGSWAESSPVGAMVGCSVY